MVPEGAGQVAESSLRCLFKWFDTEAAAVVTILLGLFQIILSASFAYTESEQSLPKLFILPLVLGVVIVGGGSFSMANEKNPSRLLLCGSAGSNFLGLLGSLLAFGFFVYNIQTAHSEDRCLGVTNYYSSHYTCPSIKLAAFSWSLTCLLLIYDTLAVIMHCFLTFTAYKTLKRG